MDQTQKKYAFKEPLSHRGFEFSSQDLILFKLSLKHILDHFQNVNLKKKCEVTLAVTLESKNVNLCRLRTVGSIPCTSSTIHQAVLKVLCFIWASHWHQYSFGFFLLFEKAYVFICKGSMQSNADWNSITKWFGRVVVLVELPISWGVWWFEVVSV